MSTRRQARSRNRRASHTVAMSGRRAKWRGYFGQTPSRTTRRRELRRLR